MTVGWLSENVVKIFDFFTTIVVFLGIKTVIITPHVGSVPYRIYDIYKLHVMTNVSKYFLL